MYRITCTEQIAISHSLAMHFDEPIFYHSLPFTTTGVGMQFQSVSMMNMQAYAVKNTNQPCFSAVAMAVS